MRHATSHWAAVVHIENWIAMHTYIHSETIACEHINTAHINTVHTSTCIHTYLHACMNAHIHTHHVAQVSSTSQTIEQEWVYEWKDTLDKFSMVRLCSERTRMGRCPAQGHSHWCCPAFTADYVHVFMLHLSEYLKCAVSEQMHCFQRFACTCFHMLWATRYILPHS